MGRECLKVPPSTTGPSGTTDPQPRSTRDTKGPGPTRMMAAEHAVSRSVLGALHRVDPSSPRLMRWVPVWVPLTAESTEAGGRHNSPKVRPRVRARGRVQTQLRDQVWNSLHGIAL